MKVREEFVQFVWGIYPEDSEGFDSLESEAASALETYTTANQRRVPAGVFNELLDGGYSDAELATSGASNRRDTASAPTVTGSFSRK